MDGSILKVLLFWFLHQYVICQVCNETRSIYQEVPETFRFSYIETYEEPCVIFCSVKTRKAVNVTSRIVERYENVTVNVCCEGYIEDETHEGNGIYCEPICNPPCQNGYCRRPYQCACEAGYALDPLNPHICKPLCLDGCDIPNCLSTKTPQCFSNNTDLFSPICTEPCVNATCIAPEICQCLPGYYQTSANICEPHNYSCEHGTRISPDTCQCDLGWQWKCGSCQPVCFGCDYGTCVSPGECECDRGYVKSDRGNCEPYCSTGCANGKCVSPEYCSCNPGWYMDRDGGECTAHCNMNCDYGDCIAPDVCACYPGYQLDSSRKNSRCVPNRKDCEGSTTLEDCKCEAPYKASYYTDEGTDCDCFGQCTNSSKICTKSTCLFMNMPVDPTPLDAPHINPYQILHEFTSSSATIETETAERRNVSRTASNLPEVIEKSEILGLPVHWLYVIIIVVAILVVLLILGIIAKKKCHKTRTLNEDKNDGIQIHYINKIS